MHEVLFESLFSAWLALYYVTIILVSWILLGYVTIGLVSYFTKQIDEMIVYIGCPDMTIQKKWVWRTFLWGWPAVAFLVAFLVGNVTVCAIARSGEVRAIRKSFRRGRIRARLVADALSKPIAACAAAYRSVCAAIVLLTHCGSHFFFERLPILFARLMQRPEELPLEPFEKAPK